MKKYWENPEYIEYITKQPCVDCGKFQGVDRFGTPRVDASHVKTKGSGGREYNNLIPQCRKCHMIFEGKTKWEKREYLKLAEKFTDMYMDEKLDSIAPVIITDRDIDSMF